MHDFDKFIKHLQESSKKEEDTVKPVTGIMAWIVIVALVCVASWLAGALVALGVFGYRVVNHLLG